MIATASARRDAEIQLLLDRALEDQISSWTRGEKTPVEAYLAREPALSRDAEAILDLIYQEYVLRRDRGETPDPNEFFARFPDHAESLMLQFGVDHAITATTRFLEEHDRPNGHACKPIETLAGYEILSLLGRGGMGIVYKARDQKLGRIVAIKTIAETQHATPDQLHRFQAEAHAIARLRHPNIVAIHAIGEHDDRAYLSLEFAEGGSLAQRLAEKPMAVREAAALVEALAHAVHAAHQAGVVHRDLKPSNVLLTADGVPKVSDFGLAKLLDVDSSHTLTGQVMGTPSYMAPEQAEGHAKQVGPAADTYALGAILYQALTGRPPFLGESAMETLKLVTSTEVVAPHLLRPEIPRDLETICLKCLEKTPVKRYATALELAEDLGRFHRGEPILARRIGPLRRLSKWTIRHPWQTTTVATVLVAASAFTGFIAWHNVQLRAEVKRTDAKAAEARRNYQEARTALQAMLARLNDRKFAEMPRMKELTRDQMQDALAFYNRILREVDANDPSVRADTARAFGLLSTLQGELGDVLQAEQQVRKALDLIRLLRSQYPENTEYQGMQVECLLRLCVYLDSLGRPDEAVEAGRESARLSEILARATPDNLSHQELVATCHDAYASRLRLRKRLAEAHDHYEKAIEIREGLDPAKFIGLIHRHAGTLMNDGSTLWNMDQYPKAESRFLEAEKCLLSLPEQQRRNVTTGRLFLNWSGLLYHSSRFGEAIDRADAGLRLVEPYLRNEPNDAGARDVCLKLHGNRALALSALEKHRESAEEWERVIAMAPDQVPPIYRMHLAIELGQVDEFPRALSQAQLVNSAADCTGVNCYNLGCLYVRCAASVRKNPSVSPEQQERLFESHVANALRWLKSAADAGFFSDPANREYARTDPDLEILLDRPEFPRLLESSGRKP